MSVPGDHTSFEYTPDLSFYDHVKRTTRVTNDMLADAFPEWVADTEGQYRTIGEVVIKREVEARIRRFEEESIQNMQGDTLVALPNQIPDASPRNDKVNVLISDDDGNVHTIYHIDRAKEL